MTKLAASPTGAISTRPHGPFTEECRHDLADLGPPVDVRAGHAPGLERPVPQLAPEHPPARTGREGSARLGAGGPPQRGAARLVAVVDRLRPADGGAAGESARGGAVRRQRRAVDA